ncbi:MAG: response regulator [Gammaproteobacteria bacterium]|nr:response regulator [Gammaproteobacteria bacterium]
MQILIVDDDPLAGELTAMLVEDAGYQTQLLESGIEALQMLSEENPFAAIISDMNMPLMDGLELFAELRQQGITTPFILLTGDDPAPLLARAPTLNACMTKSGDLISELSVLLSRVIEA